MFTTKTIEFQTMDQYLNLRAVIWREIKMIRKMNVDLNRGDELRNYIAADLRALRHLYQSLRF